VSAVLLAGACVSAIAAIVYADAGWKRTSRAATVLAGALTIAYAATGGLS
jgi:hypothetical protein